MGSRRLAMGSRRLAMGSRRLVPGPRRLALVSRALLLATAGLALAAAGCGSAAAGSSHRTGVISAVAAENEYGSVLSQIGGRYVHVTSILKNPNVDPHTFEGVPQVLQEVSGAQLIVQNGVGYDSWLTRIAGAAPNARRTVIVAQHVLGLPGSTPNPHLWYSPATMPAVAKAMAAGLSALQPAHRSYFQARLKSFDASLTPWRDAIAQFRAKYPGTTAATTEPVAGYLLTAMGIQDLTPFRFQADIMNGVEPAPQDIALENGFFSQHKVRFFAYNTQVTDALTTSIRQNALKAGVPVVGVYETMPTGHTYQSWMLAEVRAITKAVARRISTQKL